MTRKIRASLAAAGLAAAAFTAPGAAEGQDADLLIGDRPDFSESPNVVPRLQVEAGYTQRRLPGGGRVDEAGEFLLRLPLAPWLEGRLGLGSYISADVPGGSSGYGGSSLGVKVALASARGAVPDLGLLLGSTVPTGDGDVGGDAWELEARIAAAWDGAVSLSSNVGVRSDAFEDAGHTQALASVALGIPLGARLGAFGESYVVAGGDDEFVLDGGFTFLVTSTFQLDARAGVSLEWSTEDSEPFFGFGFVARP